MAKNKKRISIVFATDVVGYSRLMSENEDRTLTLLKQARDFIDQTISDYGGRIANTAGDSVIAVFESATLTLLSRLATMIQVISSSVVAAF